MLADLIADDTEHCNLDHRRAWPHTTNVPHANPEPQGFHAEARPQVIIFNDMTALDPM
jgi:hypothetical protein